MASFTGTKIKDTYKSILKVSDNGELEAAEQEITDGAGNGTGVSLNTSGDVTATGTLAFGSLKDSGENITITKFVDEADGIALNDNDTSIPTSAAVKDYVDTNVTAQDLDITDGTNNGSVDLDSQSLTFTGDAGVSATVSGQTLTLDSSALQAQITSNDTDITALQAADVTLQNNIDAEASTRATADTTLQSNIDAEAATRAAADSSEQTARLAADATLQANIDAEASTRAAADTTLQTNIDNEEAARITADSGLQTQITSNDSDISGLDTRLTTAEGNITSNDSDISALDGRLTTAEGNISSNDTDIAGLDTRLTTAEGNITSNDTDIAALQSDKQDISEKGQANGYAPLDSGAKIPIANLPDSIVGQVEYQGTWNASTNTPTLPSASTVKGHYYVVSVAGTYLTIDYAVGDWIISNGTDWEKVDNTDAVTTVFGRLGAIVANEADYSSFYPLISDLNTTNSNVSALDTRLTTAEGDITAIETKTDNITVTQPVNLDTIESDTAANTTKLAGIEDGAQVNTVDSVNTQTGAVVLDADDIDDTLTTNKFTTQAEIDKLAGIEALADVTDATNVAAAGALMSGTAALSDLVDVSSTAPNDGQVLTYDTVNGWQPEDSQGGGTDYTVQEISTNTTAVKDNLYVLTASLTLTLPASPATGDKVAVSNMSGTTTPVVARNGNLIVGLAEDLTIDVKNISVEFIYSGATEGWVIFTDSILGYASVSTVDGSGTTNYISKWSDADTLTDSVIYDDGTNVGIGTSSAATKLEVMGSGIGDTTILTLTNFEGDDTGDETANIRFRLTRSYTDPDSVTDAAFIKVGKETAWTSTSSRDSFMSIYTRDGANEPAERMRIDSSGSVIIQQGQIQYPNAGDLTLNASNAAGQIQFRVAGAERARITTNGLTFNGDTAAANALDDYEEGTWTPVYRGNTTAGSYSYLYQTGTYTKIGNLVTVTFSLVDITQISAASGYIEIAGLPYASKNITAHSYFGSLNTSRFTLNTYGKALYIPPNTSYIVIVEDISGTTSNLLNTSARTANNADIFGTITYEVA